MPDPDGDRLFEAFDNHDRRRLLLELLEYDSHEELAVHEDVPLGDDERESVHVELVHRHLPQLEERGLVDWDRDAGTVSKGPNFEEVRPLLEWLREYCTESAVNGP